jgi:acetoin utilization deacetylase AcuC-like enzyme
MVLVLTHADCARHVTPEGHPERTSRLQAALHGLDEWPLQRAEECSDDFLKRGHTGAYLNSVTQAFDRAESAQQAVSLDPDTWVSPESRSAAHLAAGAMEQAVSMLAGGAGEESKIICAVRPPGHHAEADRAMGFCLYSNIALGALQAVEAEGLTRAAVLDFDVHHGNGSEDILGARKDVFFASSHQVPLFPGTGEDTSANTETLINAPLPPGFDGARLRQAWGETILPAAQTFAPELILVSAGFDAHERDPLAQARLSNADFGWLGSAIRDLAEATPAQGRVISILEGGYDLTALQDSMRAFAHGLAGKAA